MNQQNSNLSDFLESKALWQAVILQAVHDVRSLSVTKEAREAKKDVLNWLGTKNFELICTLANLGVEKTRENIIKVIKNGE